MPGGDEFTVPLIVIKHWIGVRLEVGGRVTIDMVLDTGSPISSVSQGTALLLSAQNVMERLDEKTYILRDIRIEGQSFPDLQVRVSSRLTQVEAPGVLGLDFLRQFAEVRCTIPAPPALQPITLTLIER